MYNLSFLLTFASLFCAISVKAQVLVSRYPINNFTQSLDHNSNSTATFNQQYYLVTDYFKPGGPILFLQGPESPLNPIENHDFMDWAEELGAIVASLEHRFFGKSLPSSFDGTTASYAPLTLENVMEDAVTFLDFIKKNVTGAADSKAIVEGGSYGGNLALTFRVKRPDAFYGSFASAPITESYGPLENNTFKFRASEQLSNVYYDASAEAANKIKAAMMEFYTCAEIGKNCTSSQVTANLNLCGTAPNATQYPALYNTLVSAYRYIAQLNYPFSSTYSMPYPLQYLINNTVAASTPGDVLRIPLAMTNWQTNLTECIDWTSSNITGQVPLSVSHSFDYILCQYYPFSESAIPAGNLLPPQDGTGRVEVCAYPQFQSNIYNQSNELWQDFLGTSTEMINNTTRLVILQGGYDRVAGIGMPNLTLSDDRQQSRVVFTAGLGHAMDQYPESVVPRGQLPQLDEVRDMKLEYVKEWLGLYNSTNLWNATTVNSAQPDLSQRRVHHNSSASAAGSFSYSLRSNIPLYFVASGFLGALLL